MDLRKLKTLIDLVSESNISELEITEADGKVRIVKSEPAAPSMMTVHAGRRCRRPPCCPAPPRRRRLPPRRAEPDETGHVVKSPMVGTFYRSSTPGRQAVHRGRIGRSKEGEPVCIIEAMKIMNEIEADRSGTVTKILAENGQAVEFGQPLFVIE